MALATAVVVFGASIPLWTHFNTSTFDLQFVERLPWIPALNSTYYLGIDGISLPLILLTTLITIPVVVAAWTVIESRPAQYYAAFLIMEGLMIGVFSAADALLFYFFWEAMLIPMFLIIGVWGGPRRVYATLKFFLYTFLGSVFMLVALIYMYLQTGERLDTGAATALRPSTSCRSAPPSRCGFSSPSCWPSPSRFRWSRCTPGCPMRTSKRPPAARWCWPRSC